MLKQRIVSGTRPTGRLHIGHYFGALKNWVQLQNEYDCFFFIADWHALTTEYASPDMIHDSNKEILLDWLAVGVDPKKATLFIQSAVKQHAELHLLLSMLTPISWLERVPSFKDQQQELKTKDLSTYGFLGYPLLQTADIILYHANKVPVGIDQVPHIELAREIVRRFNKFYGNLFPEPQPLLTPSPKLLGLDRRKMSKSYNNAIYLSDDTKTVEKKIGEAITDPARQRRQDPGNPDICLIYDLHKLLSSQEEITRVGAECRSAKIGCVEDKKLITKTLNDFLNPIRKRRALFEKNPAELDDILENGRKKAEAIAETTMKAVRKAMKL